MNVPRDRNRFINGILIVVAVSLLAASIYSVYLAWRTGLAQSRAETASRLMAIRTSPRTSDTPGINAWVSWSLLSGNGNDAGDSVERLQQMVPPRSGNQIPTELQGLLSVLRSPQPNRSRPVSIREDSEATANANAALEFRRVDLVENADQLFVLTARKNAAVQETIEDFSSVASTHLSGVNAVWQQNSSLAHLSDLAKIRSARVARFYVLNEDESLISLPLPDPSADASTGSSAGNQQAVYLSEADEFRKNPLSPSFVSNNFFFNFQYDKPLGNQATYSGMYLDLGGLGLVASVMTPVIYDGKRAVLGADVAFDMDWEEFAGNLSNNLVSHVAHIKNPDAANWNPWNEFAKSLPSSKGKLQTELQYLAGLESRRPEPSPRKSIYLATARDGGDVIAIQVDRSTWLLLVTGSQIQLPWTTMLLTSLVFLTLLFRIEQSRRKAVGAQRSARNEMVEKQNLLETMQVPLMVVDPNTDEIVFCNRAAESIGMSQGDFFGKDIVSQDSQSQIHYSKTQTLGEEHRRAYGVPIKGLPSPKGATNSKDAASFAIVRSVAVTAPIESLKADERHRLGILFLVDEHRDLELLLNERVMETQQKEQRQLSSLMNHGIDSLARILRNQLQSREPLSDERFDFVNWLSGYLSERIQLMAWALDNWGKAASTKDQIVIERQTVERTVEQFNRVFAAAAADRRLREQLHWNNGVFSGITDGQPMSPHIVSDVHWSSEACFAVPREGVFGFFVSEALINAARHGMPGTQIKFEIEENRVRNELNFSVENQTRDFDAGGDGVLVNQIKPYSGTVIMMELARISGWSEPKFESDKGRHRVCWTIPVLRRKPSADSD